jgi:dihydroneopterin aldolase
MVEKVSGETKFLLLERLASEIADAALDKFHPAGVVVRVSKLNPPIAIRVGSVGVEITKLREGRGG